ncbi:hypothetical protein [Crassaminicella indica]|uniref:Uncharacterized protein n=1 Tax=Crassaminicella indica TaxID=2855394 RepID=A0ABX8RDV7_9CLOT|nr:hypothetical protein [Crassaminicella indica]QXM05121.1 hypothetical protein KVH43_06835 [Crassaminicella indica]
MNANYMFEPMLFPANQMNQFEEFMKQYGDKSEKYILDEIARIANSVPEKTIQQYIKNLDLLSQIEGFVSNEHRRKIDNVKRILLTSSYSKEQSTSAQSFGTSLLLWFLILVSIWRKPYYRPHRPYQPYPYRRRRFPFYPHY